MKRLEREGFEFYNKEGALMKCVHYTTAKNFGCIKVVTGEYYPGCNWHQQVECGSIGCSKGPRTKEAQEKIDNYSMLEEVWNRSSDEEKEKFFKNRLEGIHQNKYEYYITNTDGSDTVIFTLGLENMKIAKSMKRKLKIREISNEA